MGVYDDFCVDKVPRGDAFVQSLTKSSSSRHVCKWFEEIPRIDDRIYSTCVVRQVHPLRVKPLKRGEADSGRTTLAGQHADPRA